MVRKGISVFVGLSGRDSDSASQQAAPALGRRKLVGPGRGWQLLPMVGDRAGEVPAPLYSPGRGTFDL